jgi:L-rhamnose mutarotase
MIRRGFAMTVRPGSEEEYRRRHNPIWPDLEAVLKSHGASNYSIFLDRGSGRLFAYVEIEDEARWRQIAQTEVCRRWWASMKHLMDTNPDNSPLSIDLEEVFHMN